ncbi:Cyclic AMP response element-binding protein A [Melipona quadrifasciata]|uniref:Cyclic AMP response element-binding protein A n=1 Tax=Melipona quadrifasciata TaxID=166423 RepID=A0A0M8ZTY4_9HYME|nr:Cyclic AMP response element-binding protein A [Melipona quadrifasciata]
MIMVAVVFQISAQESRRKKKEYMDGLERRVTMLMNENSSYRDRLTALEDTNRELLKELQRLQALLQLQGSVEHPWSLIGPNDLFITLPLISLLHSIQKSGNTYLWYQVSRILEYNHLIVRPNLQFHLQIILEMKIDCKFGRIIIYLVSVYYGNSNFIKLLLVTLFHVNVIDSNCSKLHSSQTFSRTFINWTNMLNREEQGSPRIIDTVKELCSRSESEGKLQSCWDVNLNFQFQPFELNVNKCKL